MNRQKTASTLFEYADQVKQGVRHIELQTDPKKVAKIVSEAKAAIAKLEKVDLDSCVNAINELKRALHSVSPFSDEPVDCVVWVKGEIVGANDYNPNSVAPPEMELLATSILSDGYTQPIVTFKNEERHEVVDGFHRNRVGKEVEAVSNRIFGYLPVVEINSTRTDKGDRIAATIRHNRARGKHRVESMSEIVIELKRRNWTDEKIAKELGMDSDEILRLCQISGLAEMFKDQDFSKSWDIDDFVEDEQDAALEEAAIE